MERIKRQSSTARFVHWVHTISSFLLFYTGLALYIPALNGMAVVFGGIQNSRLVHHYSGFAFVGVPIVIGLANWEGLMNFVREIFNWEGKDDSESLKKFPAYLFNANTPMPSQGKLKGGQKFGGWFILASSVLISLSGIVMYFDASFSRSLVLWMYPLHELSTIVLGVFLMIHVYLGAGIFAPYRGMGRAMFGDGTVSESQAEHHWPKWAKEQKTKRE